MRFHFPKRTIKSAGRHETRCKTGHFAFRNRPFHTAKWPVLQRETGHFGLKPYTVKMITDWRKRGVLPPRLQQKDASLLTVFRAPPQRVRRRRLAVMFRFRTISSNKVSVSFCFRRNDKGMRDTPLMGMMKFGKASIEIKLWEFSCRDAKFCVCHCRLHPFF